MWLKPTIVSQGVSFYSGDNCSIDSCSLITCQNGGTCVVGDREELCYCPIGYGDMFCESYVDPCSFCLNGVCSHQLAHGTQNQYTCSSCAPGFSGTFCETSVDPCINSACLHGSCVAEITSYTCNCSSTRFGWVLRIYVYIYIYIYIY